MAARIHSVAKTSRRVARLALCAALAGCADDAPPPAPRRCPTVKREATFVIARLGFVRGDPMPEGVSDGLDLDDHDSTTGDPVGCGRPDFIAPDGRRGVDNQLARLLPAVDQLTGGALDGLIQGAINNGQLLVALTVEDLDDRCNDPDVTLVVRRVQGTTLIGADNLLDPGQTFDLTRTEPVTRARGRVIHGVLTVDPTRIPLPVAVLDARFVLNFYGARARLRLLEDGGALGILGGGVSVREFGAETDRFGIDPPVREVIRTTMRLTADLAPDESGACQQLSAAVAIVARAAFVNP